MTQDQDISLKPERKSSDTNIEVYEYENKLNDGKTGGKELVSTADNMRDLDQRMLKNKEYSSHKCSTCKGFIEKLKSYFRPGNDTSLRETIEEYIESEEKAEKDDLLSIHEKALLSNVLELHSMTAMDVMIPRADIIGIPDNITQEEMFSLLAEKQYSRFPVYNDSLDNIVGAIHIKDILTGIVRGEPFDMSRLIRDIPIVSPSMHVLDLLTQMRITRKHLALVVDEFGGIDGLITIGDLIEAIVGEIDDEHNLEIQPEIRLQPDGSILADARYDVDEFEEIYGEFLSEEEREENDTLGGLAFFLAGRVPARGEVLKHSSGMVFEIEDADPRRVKSLIIRNVPHPNHYKTSY